MSLLAYNPYLSNMGGGEKYFVDFLNVLSDDQEVTLVAYDFPDEKNLKNEFKRKFGYPIKEEIEVVSLRRKNKFLDYLRILWLSSRYKNFLTVTNRFPQISLSNNNTCIVQFPFLQDSCISKLRAKIQFTNYKRFVVYSPYVQEHLSRYVTKSKIQIIPPYIDTELDPVQKKSSSTSTIISVGRFISIENSKKQLEMITAFKKLHDLKIVPGIEMILAGSCSDRGALYLSRVKEEIKGYPIKLEINRGREKLVSFYKKSKIYWHAAGYNENLDTHPGSAEHFGITLVEAMSYGCVPIVFGKGGPVGILSNGAYGFLWLDLDTLVKQTIKVLSSKHLYNKYSNLALKRSAHYSRARFISRVKNFSKSIFSNVV